MLSCGLAALVVGTTVLSLNVDLYALNKRRSTGTSDRFLLTHVSVIFEMYVRILAGQTGLLMCRRSYFTS